MKIVVIGAAPTGLGAAYRLNELQQNNSVADNVELIVLEQVNKFNQAIQAFFLGMSQRIICYFHGFLITVGSEQVKHCSVQHSFYL